MPDQTRAVAFRDRLEVSSVHVPPENFQVSAYHFHIPWWDKPPKRMTPPATGSNPIWYASRAGGLRVGVNLLQDPLANDQVSLTMPKMPWARLEKRMTWPALASYAIAGAIWMAGAT